MEHELGKQIAFRISLLKNERQKTWAYIAEKAGFNSHQVLTNKMRSGYWPVEDLMKIADAFGVPLLYFLVPEEKVDEIMGRKEVIEEKVFNYEEHQFEIKLGKAEAEIRALREEIASKDEQIRYLANLNAANDAGNISDIVKRQLELSVALMQAVAGTLLKEDY